MAKDPAFLIMYKDILVSCADWDPDVLGWYLRLLCHQADKQGGLSPDLENLAALANVKFSQYARFSECWERMLKHKFELNDEGLLINLVQDGYLKDRREYKDKQALRGLVGYYVKLLKKEKSLTPKQINDITPLLFECLSNENTKEENEGAFKRTLEAYKEDVDAIADGNGDGNNKDRGVGKELHIAPQMVQIFKATLTTYPIDQKKDYAACVEIAHKIADMEGWPRESVTNGKQSAVQEKWTDIVLFIAGDSWYKKKSLHFINNDFQSVIQSKNGTSEKGFTKDNQQPGGSSSQQVDAFRKLRSDFLEGD